ncbi:MAG: hypothetical protein Q3978_03925 [Limosilactobacillus gorillae]|nr:hypothetical protein [Limosilactobacillus gorillae]
MYGWRASLQVILTVCTGALLNHLIKGWVQRPQPTNEVHCTMQVGHSHPATRP